MNGLRVLFELLREALLALGGNRLRSALSVIGIAVGIAAVMTVSAVSSGGRVFVIKELETFGLRSVWVYRDYADKDPHRRVRRGSGIEEQDFAVLQGPCCPAVRRLSPVVLTKGNPVVQVGNRYSNAAIKGVGAHFLAINNDRSSATATESSATCRPSRCLWPVPSVPPPRSKAYWGAGIAAPTAMPG